VFSVVVDMVVGAMVGQSPDTCGEMGAQSSERSAPKGADHQARLVVSQVFPFHIGGSSFMASAGAI